MSTPSPGAHDVLQAIVENTSDAVVLLNADGAVRFMSQSSSRVHGYTAEERIGHSELELIHPDDLAAMQASLADCLSRPGVPISTEYRLRHKDGSWRRVEAVAVNRLDERHVEAIVINFRDITAHRLAEHSVGQSEVRLRHIVEHAQDLIYSCDITGRFTYVNPMAGRVMKYESNELIGRHFLSLIREDYRQAAAALYNQQVRERTPNTYFEFPAVAKTGEIVWIGQHVQLECEDDAPVAVHAIARDITRQKDVEDTLRRSEEHYRSLVQGAAFGIYRSTSDGRILDANPAFAAMLGYLSVEDVMTRNMVDLYRSPADRAALLATGVHRQHGIGEVAWKKKDGTPILVRLVTRIIEGDEEGVTYYETIAEDVTDRRALEEQLRQAQKMEAVGRLARGVAHDFNNVLAAIIGYSELIATSVKPGNALRDDAMEIRKAAERGAALTRQLLAFSRSEAIEPRVVNLQRALDDNRSMLQQLVGPHVLIRLDMVGAAPHVRIEPGQFEQLLLNLAVNARDAMPTGGVLTLRIDAVQLDAGTIIGYPGALSGSYARLSVRDTGTGIDPEAQPHVFEPFFTTKDPSKGTGLGLSIVYGIAKDAGGSVTFTTTPGQGTTFEVLLPLVTPEQP